MKVRSLAGQEIDISANTLDSLKTLLQGQVIVPGENGYEESRTIWNGMINRRPAFIVRCLGVADVIASMKFAREHDLLLCIRGGGHNIAGTAIAEGAMMFDMSLMHGVWVDPKKKIAHAQVGCLLGDVDRETQIYGLAAVLGFVSRTGITGLTTGGGFGYLTRRWGWTSDNVLGMDVVTADGTLVRASDEENEELFWGLRGGGGNFGIVTGIDYKLYPVGPEIVGGPVAWPASEAASVLELYRKIIKEAPPELTLVIIMRPAPPAPWLPADIHGKPIIVMLACYSGDPERGEKAVAPIKSFGEPIGDVLVRRPYLQLQSLLDATQPNGRRYYWKSEYLPDIEPALCEKFVECAAKIPSPHSAAILFQLDGALNHKRNDHSAVGNRDARYVVNLASSWEDSGDDDVNIGWARAAWADMKQFSTGGTYVNFLTEDEGPDRIEAALSSSYQRLAEIKMKWDPQNVFRTNRNISPA
jgi:FAD/FMN-containing dehydrogenase